MVSMAALTILIAAAGDAPAAQDKGSYLMRTAALMEACRGDIPGMIPVADAAAKKLADGGRLFASGDPGLVSEVSGRAGGFMMIRTLGDTALQPNDVVMHFAMPDDASPIPAGAIVFGGKPGQGEPACFPGHADATGVSPRLALAADAWLFTGELIAALTRLGKTPVLYESIGAYSGNARIVQYKSGEIAYHDNLTVPPVKAGELGNRFADEITRMVKRVESEERATLDKAGAWAREARAKGGTLYMYSMGHIFPFEVENTAIGGLFKSAVWNAGFRHEYPKDTYGPNDLAVHIGYQQPTDILLRRARPAGARVVYVTVREDRDFVKDGGVLWIDPMWDWPDACVPMEGYDVPVLAASGIVNGAIAWEIYRLASQ